MSKEAMKLALEEMKVGNYNSAAERLETALAEQPAQQEPVAWISHNAGLYHFKPDESLDPLPLYLTPPQRKPLTDEEMFKIWVRVPAETEDRFAFARAIEAAHGIKEKNQ